MSENPMFPGGDELSPYERELLTHFVQECNEAAKSATKLMLFGRTAKGFPNDPKGPYDNVRDLSKEYGNVLYMATKLETFGLLRHADFMEGYEIKRDNLPRFMRFAP